MSCEFFKEKFPSCTICSSSKTIVAEENKRKFILKNKSEQTVCKIKIDGCVSKTSSAKKCDFLFCVCAEEACESARIFLVELKGQDLIQAVRQIEQTVKMLKQQGLQFDEVNARIVLSKVNTPDLKSTELIRFKKNIKKLRGDVKYKARIMEEEI